MPAYSIDPTVRVALALPGIPTYLWGSHTQTTAPTRMTISNVALTSNVATLTVQVIEGNVPVAGQTLTVTGTQQASGAFNVGGASTVVTIASASVNATTGAGTITYALTHADVTSHADSGLAVAQVATTFESVTTNELSAACALPMAQDGKSLSGFSVEIQWASGTSAGGVDVLCSDTNANSGDYQSVTTITYPQTRYDPAGLSTHFVQLKLTGALSGASTIAAKVLSR